MNQPFLSAFDAINSANTTLSPLGFWLAHGDEPLLQQWFADALLAQWQQLGLSHQRIELISAKTWYDVISELNSLSLFDSANAVIVLGNHKPDKDAITQLTDMASASASISASIATAQSSPSPTLLWLTDKLDKRGLAGKWVAPFKQYGQIVDCRIHDERQRQQIL